MPTSLPQFSNIDPKEFPNQLDRLLQSNLAEIKELLAKNEHFTWDSLMYPLEDMEDKLERFWSPLSQLHAVVNSTELRDCYQLCLPQLSNYEAAIGQNETLYRAIKLIDKQNLNKAQCKIIDDSIQSFELSGVGLPTDKKQQLETMQTQLSKLANQFENNILDASQAFSLHITSEENLAGMPEHAIDTAKELANEKGLDGWLLNLEIPCYLAVLTYADDRALREKMYFAYVTRASDQGPNAEQYDNTTLMNEMLALRHEKAKLLGFNNYAELSIATKMAKSTGEVLDFLSDLTARAHQQAKAEFNALQEFAANHYGIQELAPWDIAYVSEKNSQALFDISQEDLRPYFSHKKVISGLFTIVNKLYGVTMEECGPVDTWHPDVKCYSVLDENKQICGYIYVDLFARQQKRGGAWMDSLQSRRKLANGSIQLPIATLNCNFAKASGNKEAIFSHDEVLTLFHEFGHCLHHVLTKVDYLSASGINGVEWDAVELPSQFFENWCWDLQALTLLTQHIDNGDSLPPILFNKLLAAKNFQSAMAMMRQLEFSLFDFRIHQDFNLQDTLFIANTLADVRKKTAVVPIASYNRFQHSFSHIFGGGYAAGYYSYKWAEVLSSDAFSRFEEEGIFNQKTGHDFLQAILQVGGSTKAADAYLQFRGRPATVDALLKHTGIH